MAELTWLYSNFCKITPNLVLAEVRGTDERVQIDWLWPLSGVHSIMMVNSAHPGVGGGARPPPFHSVVLYSSYFSSTQVEGIPSMDEGTPIPKGRPCWSFC